MKLLLFLFFIICSCSKENISEKTEQKKEIIEIKNTDTCGSVTYLWRKYDTNWKLLKTDTSIHWCKVCYVDYERFKSYSKEEIEICPPSFETLQLVISKSCIK